MSAILCASPGEESVTATLMIEVFGTLTALTFVESCAGVSFRPNLSMTRWLTTSVVISAT